MQTQTTHKRGTKITEKKFTVDADDDEYTGKWNGIYLSRHG